MRSPAPVCKDKSASVERFVKRSLNSPEVMFGEIAIYLLEARLWTRGEAQGVPIPFRLAEGPEVSLIIQCESVSRYQSAASLLPNLVDAHIPQPTRRSRAFMAHFVVWSATTPTFAKIIL